MNLDEIRKAAWSADARGDSFAVLAHSKTLIAAGEPWSLSGLLLRAGAYEWGRQTRNIEGAANDYRRLALASPGPVTYQNLARALMKLGPDRYDEAYKFLLEGARHERTPEIELGLAHYFATKEEPDLSAAKQCFMAAAMRGRQAGLVGYAEMMERMDRPWSSLGARLAAIGLAPVYALLVGAKRHHRF